MGRKGTVALAPPSGGKGGARRVADDPCKCRPEGPHPFQRQPTRRRRHHRPRGISLRQATTRRGGGSGGAVQGSRSCLFLSATNQRKINRPKRSRRPNPKAHSLPRSQEPDKPASAKDFAMALAVRANSNFAGPGLLAFLSQSWQSERSSNDVQTATLDEGRGGVQGTIQRVSEQRV